MFLALFLFTGMISINAENKSNEKYVVTVDKDSSEIGRFEICDIIDK